MINSGCKRCLGFGSTLLQGNDISLMESILQTTRDILGIQKKCCVPLHPTLFAISTFPSPQGRTKLFYFLLSFHCLSCLQSYNQRRSKETVRRHFHFLPLCLCLCLSFSLQMPVCLTRQCCWAVCKRSTFSVVAHLFSMFPISFSQSLHSSFVLEYLILSL